LILPYTTIACPLFTNTSDNIYVSEEHANFFNWANSNMLTINDSKSKCIIFGNSSHFCHVPSINFVSEIKLLGVIFSSDLKWDSHVDFIIRIATRRLYALRILSNIINKYNLILIFHSLVRSVLEYCTVVFVGLNHKNSTLLEKIQRRAHHIICKFFVPATFNPLSPVVSWLPTDFFLKLLTIIFMF